MFSKIKFTFGFCVLFAVNIVLFQNCSQLGFNVVESANPDSFNLSRRGRADTTTFQAFDMSLVSAGQSVYAKNCAKCHGRDLSQFEFAVRNIDVLTTDIKNAININIPEMNKLKGVLQNAEIYNVSAAIIAAVYPALVNQPGGSVIPKELGTLAERCEKHVPVIAGKTNYRRLNKREFTYAVRDIFNDNSIQVTNFAQDYSNPDGFDGVDGVLSTSAVNTEKIVAAAESVAEQVAGKAGFNVCSASMSGVVANSAFSWIEAEAFQSNQGGTVEDDLVAGNKLLGFLNNGNYFVYKGINFSSAAKSVHMLLSTENQYAGMGIEVRADSLTGPLLGTVTMTGTGGWYNFQRQSVNITSISGTHDIYVIIRSTAATSGNIDALVFSTSTADVAVAGKSATSASTTTTRACVEKYLGNLVKLAYRNKIVPADITPLADIAMSDTTNNEGLKSAIAAILISPRFLVHVVDYSKGVSNGIHTMDAFELASRLSFMLWQSVPDQELLSLAESGQLQNESVLSAQADRMIADSRFSRFASTFPGQWLEYSNLASSKLPSGIAPEFTDEFKSSALKEAELTFTGIVRDNGALSDVFYGTQTYVDPLLAQFYSIGYPAGATGFQKVNLDSNRRRGMLTQAAVMSSSASSGTNKTIRRGVMMLEKVLCQHLGSPPPGIPPLPSEDMGVPLTIRDSLAKHRINKTCATCHNHIDPIGLAYENFTSTGKYITSTNGTNVDPSGTMADGRSFNNATDLGLIFAQDTNTEACTSKYMQMYSLGRELDETEECNAAALARDTKAKNGKLTVKQLIKSLIVSGSFSKSLIK